MSKEIRVSTKCTHHAALELAANAVGLPVSSFVRQAALEKAAAMGFHAEQPRVD